MKKVITRIGAAGASLAVAFTGIAGISASAFASSSSENDQSTYIAPLHPLNRTGVTGRAHLSLNDTQPGASLTASVTARGAEPNQIHPVHIHGMLDGAEAECPSISADTNGDRLVSVFEGAPFYGPIKVNFTTPPTKFGPPSRTDLFAPFAGVPVTENFPRSTADGKINYNQTIPFDMNNEFAVQALASLTPLTAQHIVVHGGFAPESVDTPGGDPNKMVYDPLLPIACGEIVQTHQGSKGAQTEGNDSNNEGNTDAASISNTGPGSTNTISESSSSSTVVRNNTNVSVSNSSTQTARSGHATSNSNTRGGNASTGSAVNSNQSAFFIDLINKSN